MMVSPRAVAKNTKASESTALNIAMGKTYKTSLHTPSVKIANGIQIMTPVIAFIIKAILSEKSWRLRLIKIYDKAWNRAVRSPNKIPIDMLEVYQF